MPSLRASTTQPFRPAPRPTTPRPRVLRPLGRLGRREGSLDGGWFDAARALILTPLDEVRALDATAFTHLPVTTVLELELPGHIGPVWLRSARGRGAAVDAPVLDGPTFDALAIAVASDRVRPVDFVALVEALTRDPHADGIAIVSAWMDGVAPSTPRLTIGTILERLGVKLFSVRLEGDAVEELAANGPALGLVG